MVTSFQDDYKNFLGGQEYRSTVPVEQTSAPQIDFSRDFQRFSQDNPEFKSSIPETAVLPPPPDMKEQKAAEDEMGKAIALYRSNKMDVSPEEIASAQLTNEAKEQNGVLSSLLNKQGVITQRFGNRNPIERFSKGINYGTDIAVPEGTKAALPAGTWKIEEAFSGATASGPNNRQSAINRGYGNSVLATNTRTGEKLRLSHLSKVDVRPGQVVQGGTVIGKTGATGNVAGATGQHLDLEYYDSSGRVSDVLKSAYAKSILGNRILGNNS